MPFDWSEYTDDSATENVALLLSERSQQLVLSALQSMDSRESWLEVNDATWDDIEEATAEAYEEIMEVIAPVVNQQQFGVYARASDLTLPAATNTLIPFDAPSPPATVDPQGWMVSPARTNFVLPEAGYYQVALNALFGNVASGVRLLRIEIDGVVVLQTSISVAANPALGLSNIIHISASATLQCFAFSTLASILDFNIIYTRLSIVRLYNSDY